MALVSLAAAGKQGGAAVTRATIQLPRIGAWVADLHLDTSEVPVGKVDLRLGAQTLKGKVQRASLVEGAVRARVVAGADGLRSLVKGKHYTSPTIKVVLADLVGNVGETLSSTAASAVLTTQLQHWTTVAMPAGQAIQALLERAPAGTAWRLLPDGSLWAGPETWPDSGLEFRLLAERPEDGTIEVGLDQPYLLPGIKLGSHRVDEIELRVNGAVVRALISTAP